MKNKPKVKLTQTQEYYVNILRGGAKLKRKKCKGVFTYHIEKGDYGNNISVPRSTAVALIKKGVVNKTLRLNKEWLPNPAI